jgi:hypothetical protein
MSRAGGPAAIQPTVLGVVAEPETAGFRLATLSEMAAIFQAEHSSDQPQGLNHRFGVRGI